MELTKEELQKIMDIEGKKLQKRVEAMKNPHKLDEDFKRLVNYSPINIKEKKVGEYLILREVKKKGELLTVISTRNAFMMGYTPTKIKLEEDRIIHKLCLNDGSLLMSDSPQEMFLQYPAYKQAKGRVLVGGLGLGIISLLMAQKKEVKEIIVIEKSKEIISMTKPNHKKIKVIHQNIWDFLKETNEEFDFAYIDIHYGTGAKEYVHTVLPMRKILEARFPNLPVEFWAEQEMKSQHEDSWKKGVGLPC